MKEHRTVDLSKGEEYGTIHYVSQPHIKTHLFIYDFFSPESNDFVVFSIKYIYVTDELATDSFSKQSVP